MPFKGPSCLLLTLLLLAPLASAGELYCIRRAEGFLDRATSPLSEMTLPITLNLEPFLSIRKPQGATTQSFQHLALASEIALSKNTPAQLTAFHTESELRWNLQGHVGGLTPEVWELHTIGLKLDRPVNDATSISFRLLAGNYRLDGVQEISAFPFGLGLSTGGEFLNSPGLNISWAAGGAIDLAGMERAKRDGELLAKGFILYRFNGSAAVTYKPNRDSRFSCSVGPSLTASKGSFELVPAITGDVILGKKRNAHAYVSFSKPQERARGESQVEHRDQITVGAGFAY